MNDFYIGIDPGRDGFITTYYNNEYEFYAFPKIKNVVDYRELSNIFISFISENKNFHCVLEDVHAIFGSSAKATFNFGHIQGFVEGCLNICQIPYTKVQPKKWQREMWEGVTIVKKSSSTGKTQVTDTKSTSLQAVKRLFPTIDLRATDRSKKPHDGKVDSLLICEYCKRKI